MNEKNPRRAECVQWAVAFTWVVGMMQARTDHFPYSVGVGLWVVFTGWLLFRAIEWLSRW